jgi:RimJ/RimL family protein N-acetyltransferase
MPELRLRAALLRPWRPGDEPALVRHANNRRIWLNMRDRFPHPYTRADAEAWVRCTADASPTTEFAIVVAGEAAGGIGLRPGEDVHRRAAEISYWLGEAHWGRGIATEAVRAVTDHAFDALDLCRVWAGVFEDNAASARVLEKAGYVFEGRLRKNVTKAGRTLDELVYAVVRS